MRSALRRLTQLLRGDAALLLGSALLLVGVTWPFLSSPVVLGWDTLPHVHVLETMVAALREGRLFAYDQSWLSGYPVFTFYGFTFYAVVAGVYLLLGGLVPLVLLYKLAVVGTLVAFVVALRSCARAWFGTEAGRWSLLAGHAFLYSQVGIGMGIGVNGAVLCGLFISVLGLSLTLWVLVAVRGVLDGSRHARWVLPLLLATLVLTHTLSAIVACALTATILLSRGRWRALVVAGVWTFALTAFWLVPFIAGHSAGFTSGEETFARQLSFRGSDPFLGYDADTPRGSFASLVSLPWLQVVLLCAFLLGTYRLLRVGKFEFPLTLALFVFLVEHDVAPTLLQLPIHYFRWYATAFALYLAVAAYGLALTARSLRPPYAAALASVLITATLAGYWTSHYPRTILQNTEAFSAAHAGATALAAALRAQNVTGRVVVERTMATDAPHLYTTVLPAHGTDVATGLLAESSLVTRTVFPAIGELTHSAVWAKRYPAHSGDLTRSLRDLADAGVEWLVLTEPPSISQLDAYLEGHPDGPVRTAGTIFETYHLYRLPSFRPLLSQPAYDPVLLVDFSGRTREETLIELHVQERPRAVPIALPRRNFSWPAAEEVVPFRLVALRIDRVDAEVERFLATLSGQELFLLLNDGEGIPESTHDLARARGVTLWLLPQGGPPALTTFIAARPERYGRSARVVPTTALEQHRISFDAEGPVVVNLGSFPYWTTGGTPATWLAPDRMLVFASGPTTVTYAAPPGVRALGVASLLALFLLLVLHSPWWGRLWATRPWAAPPIRTPAPQGRSRSPRRAPAPRE